MADEVVSQANALGRKNERGGTIYCIGMEGTELVKIGITRRAISTRLADLQVGCPFRLSLLGYVDVADSLESVEKTIHRLLEDAHRQGEWFAVDIDQAKLESLVRRAQEFLADYAHPLLPMAYPDRPAPLAESSCLPLETAPDHENRDEALSEIITWWKLRKDVLHKTKDPRRQTGRATYHVEVRWIEAIRALADLEGLSLAYVVNEAFRQYFEKSRGCKSSGMSDLRLFPPA
jgi:hypothetical protein